MLKDKRLNRVRKNVDLSPHAQEKIRQEIRALCDTNEMEDQRADGNRMMTKNTKLCCSRKKRNKKGGGDEGGKRNGMVRAWSINSTYRVVRVVASRSRLCELPTMRMGEEPWIALVNVTTSRYQVTEAVDKVP